MLYNSGRYNFFFVEQEYSKVDIGWLNPVRLGAETKIYQFHGKSRKYSLKLGCGQCCLLQLW